MAMINTILKSLVDLPFSLEDFFLLFEYFLDTFPSYLSSKLLLFERDGHANVFNDYKQKTVK